MIIEKSHSTRTNHLGIALQTEQIALGQCCIISGNCYKKSYNFVTPYHFFGYELGELFAKRSSNFKPFSLNDKSHQLKLSP